MFVNIFNGRVNGYSEFGDMDLGSISTMSQEDMEFMEWCENHS